MEIPAAIQEFAGDNRREMQEFAYELKMKRERERRGKTGIMHVRLVRETCVSETQLGTRRALIKGSDVTLWSKSQRQVNAWRQRSCASREEEELIRLPIG